MSYHNDCVPPWVMPPIVTPVATKSNNTLMEGTHAGAMVEFYRRKISDNTEAMREYIQGEVPIKELCFYEGAVSAMLSTCPQHRLLNVYRPRILSLPPCDNPFIYPLLCAFGLAELLQHQDGSDANFTGKDVCVKSVTINLNVFLFIYAA